MILGNNENKKMTVYIPAEQQSGLEALTILENVKLKYAEIELAVEKFNAGTFNGSVHVVKTFNVFEELKTKNNYFDDSVKQIPVPVFFNPSDCTFKEYVETCIKSISLLKEVSADITASYHLLKKATVTGTVPFTAKTHRYEKLYNDAKDSFDKCVHNTGSGYQTLNSVYKNYSEAEDVVNYFNESVKELKSRDGEIIKKQTDQFIKIIRMLKRKVDINDVSLTDDTGKIINVISNRINDGLILGGKLLGLLNELSRTLELQIETFKTFKEIKK